VTNDRERLGHALRTLRAAAGLSATELAATLHWSQSKVSRVERGATPARPHEAEAWALATGARPSADLLALAARVTYQATARRRELAPGAVRTREEVARLAEHASLVRAFGVDVVPEPTPAPCRLLTTEAALAGPLNHLPHLDVGVVPLGAPVRVFCSFTVFDEALVLVTTLTRAVHIRDRAEITRYVAHFEELRGASVPLRDLVANR
jgi:transcriptional regulator with XRE-family HTH domain